MAKYDNKTKYKIIDEVCNGKAAIDIQREYGIGTPTTIKWLRTFAENGPFKGDKLTPKDRSHFIVVLATMSYSRLISLVVLPLHTSSMILYFVLLSYAITYFFPIMYFLVIFFSSSYHESISVFIESAMPRSSELVAWLRALVTSVTVGSV